MNALFTWVDAHTEAIQNTYAKLHKEPELAFQEYKTAAFLAEELRRLGFTVTEGIGGTGVLGVMKGREEGLTFALRADMDALPIEEKTGLPYASVNPGVMHACGHDSHCTMALFAVKALMANGGVRRGTLKVVFQPAEEVLGGARAFIKSGLLDDVDEIVGIHVRNDTEARVGEAISGIWHSASRKVIARVTGKAAHGAWPHRGNNAIHALAGIINNINAIHVDPRVVHSVKATRCSGGGSLNTIPEAAEVAFDLRSQTNDVMDDLYMKTRRAIEAGVAGVGCTVEIVDYSGVPAAELNEKLISDAARSIEAVCGNALPPLTTPGSEDFHCYAVEAGIRSTFIGIGAGMGTGGHTANMVVDLKALPVGTKILAHLAAAKVG